MRVRLCVDVEAHQLDLGVGRDRLDRDVRVLDAPDGARRSCCPSTVATSAQRRASPRRAAACTRKASSTSSPFLASLNGADCRLGAPARGQLGRDRAGGAGAVGLDAHAERPCRRRVGEHEQRRARRRRSPAAAPRARASARRRPGRSTCTTSGRVQRQRRAADGDDELGRRRRRRSGGRSAPDRARSSGPCSGGAASQ